MQIVIFCHPDFFNSQSMPLFAGMIYKGMVARGHQVECWKPVPMLFRLSAPKAAKKWLGYIDQFIVFPLQVRKRLRQTPADTLFVFADQALGPWVPMVKNRPHVIHCHDFMALCSALGHYSQNPVSWSGRLYQSLIRWGFSTGNCFISVSDKTREDLHGFLPNRPDLSMRIYNGLNYEFAPIPAQEACELLDRHGLTVSPAGFLLHVGGNQWYKNRAGVLHIYRAYCRIVDRPLPLCLIGAEPDTILRSLANDIPQSGKVVFLTDIPTQVIQAAYSLAAALIFPSIAEGFGWPIAEAMACGCLVLATGRAPMTEVGGDAAIYLPEIRSLSETDDWAKRCAELVSQVIHYPEATKQDLRDRGLRQARLFNTDDALDSYASIYSRILYESVGH